MKKSLLQIIVILVLGVFAQSVFAQPSNDECVGAIFISDPNSCGTFSLDGATASGFGPSSCAGSVNGDIWFSFVPEATSVTITVNGSTTNNPNGTLSAPAIAIYRNDCNNLNELRCGSDNGGSNFAEITLDGVFVGIPYLIRVDSRSATGLGSFELCLNNFNQPALPGADCVTRALLCDKSSFTVESVIGAGNDTREMDGATCFNGASTNLETNSTWFTWTADNNGSLEFSLTPLNISDDLDFVLYLLPNGVNDCSDKQQIRCMASGEGTFNGDGRCNGATGLRSSSNDTEELSGCEQASNDNFLAAVEMLAGQSYALVVNNFSGGGNGFEVEFGGSGEFRGPEPAFTQSPNGDDACLGSQITFTDASTYADGNIASWAWTFGIGADVETATGQGPHNVTYNTPGVKQIVLTVETDQGCIITDIQDVVIDACCQTRNAISETSATTNSNCWDTSEGSISLSVSSNYGPHRILWDDGSSTPSRTDLFAGGYMVTVTGTFCDTIFSYAIDAPDPIVTDTVIGMPTCDGGMDGSIALNPEGGTGIYEYQWNNTPYTTDNTFNNIGIGTYPVVIRDAIGCDDTLSIEVNELQLLLVPGEQNVTMPNCFGENSGRVVLNIDNGQGPFSYDFNDGQGYLTQNERSNLVAGTYNVDVLDANRCRGQFTFEVTDHPELLVDIDGMDISCNGEDDGSAIATLTGGVDGYSYAWDNGANTAEIINLTPGTYRVTGRDANGCEVTDNINIIEPGPIGLTTEAEDVICNGDETGTIIISPFGGTGPFTFSLDGMNFSPETVFDNLPADEYTITIRDVNDCTNTNNATILEPPPLVIDAGVDQTINFAFGTTISTTYAPLSRIVTYSWTPSGEGVDCNDCANIRVSPFETTDYVVRIEDQTMCTAFDTIRITVNDIRPIYVPNVFSPNADGTNDRLGVFSNIAAVNVDLFQIFDRWGGLVYEAKDLPLNDPTSGWDGTYNGKSLNADVFIYQAKIRFLDNEVRDYSGDVTLLR